MSVDNLYYPHALSANGQIISRLPTVDNNLGYTVGREMSGGDPGPCFSANYSAEPESRYGTPSAKPLLTAILADSQGRHSLASLVSGGSVVLYYQKGKPFSFRESHSSAVHYSMVMTQTAMLVLDRITARQDESALFDFRILVGRVDADTDPIVYTGTATLPAASCDSLYSLGPSRINNSVIPGVTGWTYELNHDIARPRSDGEQSAGYVGSNTIQPEMTITTNALTQKQANFLFGGKAMASADFWLKRRRTENMFYDKGDNEHIKLELKPGLVNVPQDSGSPSEVTIKCYPNVDLADAQLKTHTFLLDVPYTLTS